MALFFRADAVCRLRKRGTPTATSQMALFFRANIIIRRAELCNPTATSQMALFFRQAGGRNPQDQANAYSHVSNGFVLSQHPLNTVAHNTL